MPSRGSSVHRLITLCRPVFVLLMDNSSDLQIVSHKCPHLTERALALYYKSLNPHSEWVQLHKAHTIQHLLHSLKKYSTSFHYPTLDSY